MSTPKSEIDLKLKILFPTPFTYSSGYIFDKSNQMVAEVRGWGYLQYQNNAEELQDRLGENIAEALNTHFKNQ